MWFQNRRAKWRKQEKVGPQGHPYNPYLTTEVATTSSVIAPTIPNPFTVVDNFRTHEPSECSSYSSHCHLSLPSDYSIHSYHQVAPPLLQPRFNLPLTSTASFQNFLANLSEAQPPKIFCSPSAASAVHAPPPTSVPESPSLIPAALTAISGSSKSNSALTRNRPDADLRTNSIASLRLKAREYEMQLELLRKNGDLLS